MHREFLIGTTVSLNGTTTLAVVIYDPACPRDMVAVFEMTDDDDGRSRWVPSEQLRPCTCSVPGTQHQACETHGVPN